jgi:hypothetical protein
MPIHIALDTNHTPSTHRTDNCRVGFQLDSAASTAPVFVQQHNDVVAGVDELLCLQAALAPRLEILFAPKCLDGLGKTVGYAALFEPADGAVELDLGIDQLCRLFQVPSQQRLEGLPHQFHVLLRHRPLSIRDPSEGLATKTISNHLNFAHGLLAFAVKRGWAESNPVAAVDRPHVTGTDPDIRYLDRSEVEALLRAVPDDRLGPTDWVLYLTATMAGLRQSLWRSDGRTLTGAPG